MIPPRLVRTVPKETTNQVEQYWAAACRMHPDWDHVTWRDPINPASFPMTSPHWHRCESGAQFAGLVRLEALWRWGGIYLDSDVECFRPLDSLLTVPIFACYEDPTIVPDAVLGATAGHPAIGECLRLAIERINSSETHWMTGRGSWSTGPGVTTTVLKSRRDVLLLPPGSFFPYHYSAKATVDMDTVRAENPWAFAAHHWHHSWA
jgi:mannosyltransferase OCH1-like enzyme